MAKLLLDGEADIGVATESLAEYPDLLALPCYRWTHSVVVLQAQPLADDVQAGRPLTLQRLAEFPLMTYETGYTGRSHIDDAFGKAGVQPQIILEAMVADVWDYVHALITMFASPLTLDHVRLALATSKTAAVTP